jgi:signal transduction histidine kinase
MLPAARQNDAPTDERDGAPAPRLEEQKRSFLRVVSHELRTPLNSILGFSEILASELYGPLGAVQYRQYAEIIHSSGEKLLKLVNQVVEIARLQSGDMEFVVETEPLAPIFEKLGDGLDQALASRNLRLVIGPCPRRPGQPAAERHRLFARWRRDHRHRPPGRGRPRDRRPQRGRRRRP